MSGPDAATLDDFFTLAMARNVRDGDIMHVGAAQGEVWRAVEIARRLHAPRVRVAAAGTYLLDRDRIEPRLMSARTYTRDVAEAREATLNQSHFFGDLHYDRVCFPGAIEVDRLGNGNLIGFTTKGRNVRGPGSAGLTTLTSFSTRFYFALRRHAPTTLVETVAKISVLGDPALRRRWGYAPLGLHEVITPWASFRQTETGLKLAAVTPGASVEEVAAITGFAIRTTEDFGPRAAISPDERAALDAIRISKGEDT